MNNRITPFVKRMRTDGGTIYTFSSAIEDIGLNINERNNVVKISHFALLEIPTINQPSSLVENRFNVLGIPGAFEYWKNGGSIKDGRVLIAESFQNYALNLESNLLNLTTYDPTLQRTVTERVFWKWLKETGSIRWSNPSNGYWTEAEDSDGSAGYNSVVKYVGLVSAGNVRSDSFGTFNETYILVPTSHGQLEAHWEQVEDSNYRHGMEIGNLGENILGRESWLFPHPDGLEFKGYYDFVDSSVSIAGYDTYYDAIHKGWWYTAEGRTPSSVKNAYLTDSSTYLTTGIYDVSLRYVGPDNISFLRSNVDCMSLVWDINKLKTIYGDPNLTFDSMATGNYAVNDKFDFNVVLIYYTVYNSAQDTVLATNMLGILFLDAPSGNTLLIGEALEGIVIPSLEKIQSGVGGFGTSYSLRLNIKTDNMVDDTGATIIDAATSDQLYAEDWNEAFYELSKAINILSKNNGTLNYIYNQYSQIESTQTQILNNIADLQYKVADIGRDITGTENAIPIFSSGDDPLTESSIYMRMGKIGFFNNDPKWPIQMDASLKTQSIYFATTIFDVSGNIVLGYNSGLQIGASTNYNTLSVYTGNSSPAIFIDTSNNVHIPSLNPLYPLVKEASLGASSFMWSNGYLEASINIGSIAGFVKESSLNPTNFQWVAGLLQINASLGVSQTYVDGSLATKTSYTYVDGSLARRDSSINALFSKNTVQDASLSLLRVWNIALDASVIALRAQDASLISLNNWDANQDASILFLNSSKADKNANLAYITTNYILLPTDNNKIIEASTGTTLNIYLPTNVSIGFQAVIVNVGVGTVQLNPSTGATLYTRDSSVKLIKRYSGATVYSRGTTWVGMGDLN